MRQFNLNLYIFTTIKGTRITAENPATKHKIRRNISHFQFLPWTAPLLKVRFDSEEEEEEVPGMQQLYHGHQNVGDVQHHQQTQIRQKQLPQCKAYQCRIWRDPRKLHKY